MKTQGRKYRNVFKFPPWWLLGRRHSIVLGGMVVSIVIDVVVVLALGYWGPLEKDEMGTVITVRSIVAAEVIL